MTEIIRPPSFSENLDMADHARAAREQLNAIEQALTATLDADAYALLADAFAAVGALQSHLYDRAIAQNAAAAAALRPA
jgi:endo-alpha-1,4-polygalactosaminidase (GH114 family)